MQEATDSPVRLSKAEHARRARERKATALLNAHHELLPHLDQLERALELTLMDDGQWRRLADFAGIKPTNEPGTCVVSRAVKRIVYELAHVGAAVRYRQAHEDVMT